MYVHVGGVGGRNNSRRDSANSVSTPPTPEQPSADAPAYYWDNGVPPIAQAPPFLDPSYGTGFITSNPTGVQNPVLGDPRLGGKPPYYQNWNFNVQRSLSGNMTVRVAYSASAGKFLAGAGRRDAPINVTPLPVSLTGFVAHDHGVTHHDRPGATAMCRASGCHSRTSSAPSARCFGHSRSTAPSVTRGSTSVSPAIRGCRPPAQPPLQQRLRLLDRLHALASNWTICWPPPATPSIVPWKKRAAPSTIPTCSPVPSLTSYRSEPATASIRVMPPFARWSAIGRFPVSSRSPVAPLALVGTACTTGGILGTCIHNYNPSFNGNVRINGDYGDGNVLGSSVTPFFDRTRSLPPPRILWAICRGPESTVSTRRTFHGLTSTSAACSQFAKRSNSRAGRRVQR